jgi:hypothetical protein
MIKQVNSHFKPLCREVRIGDELIDPNFLTWQMRQGKAIGRGFFAEGGIAANGWAIDFMGGAFFAIWGTLSLGRSGERKPWIREGTTNGRGWRMPASKANYG